jgi:hypothetical protein
MFIRNVSELLADYTDFKCLRPDAPAWTGCPKSVLMAGSGLEHFRSATIGDCAKQSDWSGERLEVSPTDACDFLELSLTHSHSVTGSPDLHLYMAYA